jgi:hypothetical protein
VVTLTILSVNLSKLSYFEPCTFSFHQFHLQVPNKFSFHNQSSSAFSKEISDSTCVSFYIRFQFFGSNSSAYFQSIVT